MTIKEFFKQAVRIPSFYGIIGCLVVLIWLIFSLKSDHTEEPETLDLWDLDYWVLFDEAKSDEFVDSFYHNTSKPYIQFEADSLDIELLNSPTFGEGWFGRIN